jgi:hypothetical protein
MVEHLGSGSGDPISADTMGYAEVKADEANYGIEEARKSDGQNFLCVQFFSVLFIS